MEILGNFLLEKREENKDEMEATIKTTYIGDIGELFALKYLKKLFEANNIKNDIVPHKYSQEKYDLDIYINNEKYVIEVKFSTKEKKPIFEAIHFNNEFKYLLLIWHPSYDKIYFAILTKDEARDIAHPTNAEREEEDNWYVYAPEYFDDDNKEFLNRLSKFLELKEELEDLEDEDKLSLIEEAKEEVIKKHPNAIRKDFSGITYQQWFYEYLSNYTDEVEPKPKGDEYDIEFKGRHIEIKYSALNNKKGEFKFEAIKPNLFHFIFFIGFDEKENKFYFSIKTRDEIIEIKKETSGTDDYYSENGFTLNVGKHSIINFVNDFTFEDFDNYIESY